jgi:hypothetical protein
MLTKFEFYSLLIGIVVAAVLITAFCYSFLDDELDGK